MMVRCQLCNTPLFKLTIRENEAIIIVKGKHHGEWHKSKIQIEEWIAQAKNEQRDAAGEVVQRADGLLN